ncbi:MAG: hypothetical protein KC800_21100 [Candidatus Eremiobacteraeota bacterium]|nr:hypothetical protein [Candidatus Eremiobacteraeota bacterium]
MTNWKELFRNHRHLLLALKLRSEQPTRTVRCLGDEQVVLLGGAAGGARQSKRKPTEHEILSVVVTPEAKPEADAFQTLVQEARVDYPHAELTGFGPEVASLDVVGVCLGHAGQTFEPEPIGEVAGKPVVAALKYSPDVSPEALESACRAASGIAGLRSVVPLPLAAGDRIPLQGATTSGPTDVMVVSVLRHFLPTEVRVRASWAALGWKVAQMALIHGADELAGWSVAESVAYSARVRAAARVETDEIKCGVEEAGKLWAPWPAVEEVTR